MLFYVGSYFRMQNQINAQPNIVFFFSEMSAIHIFYTPTWQHVYSYKRRKKNKTEHVYYTYVKRTLADIHGFYFRLAHL